MTFYVFDVETDDLYDEVTKAYCLSYQKIIDGKVVEHKTLTEYSEIALFFTYPGYFVCHNVLRFDNPVVEKLLGIDLSSVSFIDTLGISWYLFCQNRKHGLEYWGEILKVPKPKVEDWKNADLSVYIHRCEFDVEINTRLFKFFMSYLFDIYGDFDKIIRLVGYLNFKMDCLWEQERNAIPFNREVCMSSLNKLREIYEEKTEILSSSMPKHLGKVLKSRPKKMYKADGMISNLGLKWLKYFTDNNLEYHPDITEVREDPNPNSTNQLKEWLYSLGWEPETFKISKNTGEKVPQVSLSFGRGLCTSVKALYEEEPALQELDNYYKIRHRIGLLEAFLKHEKNGYLIATAHGFTNTLRLAHANPVVNLPKPSVLYGKEIRECLYVNSEEDIMFGTDVSSLEDNTKQHYIYFFDPKYVEDMRTPGFDPHLDIGILGGSVTKEEADFYKYMDGKPIECPEKYKNLSEDESKKLFKSIKKKRSGDKQVNFSATYGAGPAKMAETGKKPFSWGQKMHKIYWKRNWAVKKTAEECIVKRVSYTNVFKKEGEIYDIKYQKWLYNPVSGFWMFLKADKDKFSTLNQSTGVYVFDSWLRIARRELKKLSVPVRMQYHDEFMGICKKDQKETVEKCLRQSMEETNEEIQLNVSIGISVDWGFNYATVH